MNGPCTIASQEKQVLYVIDPPNNRWSIVLQRKHIPDSDENQDLALDISKTHSFATQLCISYEENDPYDVRAIHYDNQKRDIGELKSKYFM